MHGNIGPQTLKFRPWWIALGFGFVLLVVYLSLTPDPPAIGTAYNFDYGHLIAYLWLMIWFAQIHRDTRIRLIWAAAFCALGIALEFVQDMTGYRQFEYSDMLLDAIGVAIGFGLAQTPLQNGLRTIESVLGKR